VPVRTDQEAEAGLGAVGLAELAELVGALVVDRLDPEAVAEIGYLHDRRLAVEIEEPEPVDGVSTASARISRKHLSALGKMRTTWVRRLISPLRRSSRLIDFRSL
jgi:hypothetical protein